MATLTFLSRPNVFCTEALPNVFSPTSLALLLSRKAPLRISEADALPLLTRTTVFPE
jgi:hypothetical protein